MLSLVGFSSFQFKKVLLTQSKFIRSLCTQRCMTRFSFNYYLLSYSNSKPLINMIQFLPFLKTFIFFSDVMVRQKLKMLARSSSCVTRVKRLVTLTLTTNIKDFRRFTNFRGIKRTQLRLNLFYSSEISKSTDSWSPPPELKEGPCNCKWKETI